LNISGTETMTSAVSASSPSPIDSEIRCARRDDRLQLAAHVKPRGAGSSPARLYVSERSRAAWDLPLFA
jgi:hypothetical protein